MRRTFLAIDNAAFTFLKNGSLHLSKPVVRQEPVVAPSDFESDAPDNLACHFYGTVLWDRGRFRMWYYACHWGFNPDWPPRMKQQMAKPPSWVSSDAPLGQGPLCYAESDDGVLWTKPALGQLLFKGNRDNNALALPHTIVSGAIVIRDEEEPDPAQRYKMTYQFFPDQTAPVIEEYGTMPSVALAVSPDGLKWTVIGIPFRNQFVEPASFIKHAGQYIIHYQTANDWGGYMGEGGSFCGRTGVARVTHDFTRWPDVLAEAFAMPEPEDRSTRGANGSYDQVHLGVGAASLGNVCVGLFGLWHNADNSRGFGEISCDFGLLVSNDGIRFREPVKGHRFLRRDDSLVTPVAGRDFNTILCQANGILNVGEETRIYHGRWRNAGSWGVSELRHYAAEVALATLPRDRWGSLALNPGTVEGDLVTAPMRLSDREVDCELTINADGIAGVAVDLLDETFQPIAGFTSGTLGDVDGLDCAARWPARRLSELAGEIIRVRLRLRQSDSAKPRIYAMYLRG